MTATPFPSGFMGAEGLGGKAGGSRGGDVVLREYRSEAAARTALTPCGSVQSWTAPNSRRFVADRACRPREGWVRAPSGIKPGGHAAGASEALLEESAWSRLATISTVRRVLPSVACHWRLCKRPSM